MNEINFNLIGLFILNQLSTSKLKATLVYKRAKGYTLNKQLNKLLNKS
jgi:hypothetical protein